MRRVEREEERGDPDKQAFHLCIINLVIGTLYCAKVPTPITHQPSKHLPITHQPHTPPRAWGTCPPPTDTCLPSRAPPG